MNKALLLIHKLNKTYFKPLALITIIVGLWFVMSSNALGWPTNRLDSASGKDTCTYCHRQASGTLTITTINGTAPLLKNQVVVSPGNSFDLEFNTKGFGYNRFTVAGAIKVPGTDKWTATLGPIWNQNSKSGQTKWTIAKQDTSKGAPADSPYMLVTDFTSAAPLNQKGVTKDDGSASDLNGLYHDETFTVNVQVDSSVAPGMYTLYIQGIGSDSASRLAYNQQQLTVYVNGEGVAPAAPASLIVTNNPGVGSQMNISWTKPGDADLAGYYLYRSKDDVVYQEIYKTNDPNTLSFTDTNLKQSTLYYYKIAAYDTSNNTSGYSTVQSATTSGTARNDTEAPAKITDLKALASVNQVTLTWSASVHGDILKYYVYRSTIPGNFDFNNSLGETTGASYTDNTATNGQYYYYVIKAVDVSNNFSVKSNMVTAAPANNNGAVQPHGMYSTNENLCQYCHNTHTAGGNSLTVKDIMSETCYTCHDGTQSIYNVKTSFDITTNPSHHKVPEGRLDCGDCHAPHDNPATNPRILKGKREDRANPQYNPDKAGYILNWDLLGTWASTSLSSTQYITEANAAPYPGLAEGGKTWAAYNSTNANSNGYIDLRAAGAFGTTNNLEGYAYTWIYSSYTRNANLHVASDDGVKVYINGLLMHTNAANRDYQPDEDEIYNITLFKGWNRLLLKVNQDNNDTSWGFGVRFHDHIKNKPITDLGIDLSGPKNNGQPIKTATTGNSYCWVCHGNDSILPDPYGDHQTYLSQSWNMHNNSPSMPNPPSGTNIKCMNCHTPHGSANGPLLQGPNDHNFCINCHVSKNFTTTKAYPYSDGTLPTIPNSSNYFAGSQHEIAFAGQNGCILCHDPHGTSFDTTNDNKMIIMPLLLSRITGGNGGTGTHNTTGANAEICFRCHDQRYYYNNGGNPITGSKFGNGNGRNYHWHVNDFNLSCRSCHDPHGSMNSQYQNTTISGQTGGQLNNPENVNFDWSIANNGVTESGNYGNKIGFVATGTSAGKATGYTCYLNCGKNHGTGESYRRNNTGAPGVSCISCHSVEEFKKNSKHPYLKPGAKSGLTVKCETCHIPDHSKHNASNPKGLNINTTVAWTYNASTENVTFSVYAKDFCWTCHGNPTVRSYGTVRMMVYNNVGDHESKFNGKPHSTLQRQGTANPYGDGKDMPCMECHVYHGSSNTNLLRSVIDGTPIDAFTDEGKINACMACHDGAYGSKVMPNINSLYNAPKYPGHYFKGTKVKLLCTECHSPHGTDNPLYLLAGTQPTGATFPTSMATLDVRRVCNSCHPYSDYAGPDQTYSSGTGKATMYPMPTSIVEHSSSSTASCALCHDPHKPWPATGSNGACYTCHGNGGDADGNIEQLMGTTTLGVTKGQKAGIVSFHKISDASTPNTNDCMTNCHSTHPHDPRADHIPGSSTSTANNEKELCLNCHQTGASGSQPKINEVQYANKPHDYFKDTKLFNDGSKFQGNCVKCHEPHGSSYTKLLKAENGDPLCTICHDGKHTDGNGATISNIKTLYDKVGHYYSADKTKKLRCAECHIPHGSSNVKYLRDDQTTTIKNADNSIRPFPQNMDSTNYSSRSFCTTCHLPNNGGALDKVTYTTTSAPSGSIEILEIPINTKHNLIIPEHGSSYSTPCTNCHNAHDPNPVGNNKDCFKCHGNGSYAYNIQTLTGYVYEVSPGVWDNVYGRSTSIVSSHRIQDPNSENTNTCMTNCHRPHVHNPRANLIKDYRTGSVDVTPPNPPISLTATVKGTSRVDLQWSAPADADILGYYVYSSTDGTNYNTVGVTGNITFSDGGLTPGVNIWYKVKTYDKAGNISGFSNVAGPVAPSLAGDTFPPSNPVNLAVTNTTTSTIRLAWNASTDNVEVKGYNIYRSLDGTSYTLIGKTGETIFTDGGLTPNTQYYYKVSAYDSKNQESGQSSAVVGQTLTNLNTSKGLYTNGSDKLEFFLGTTNTTDFSTGEPVRVKLTTTSLANVTTRRDTTIYDWKGTQIARYTTATVTKTTSPYEIETTFNAPATPGVYTVWVNWTSGSGANISTYETMVVSATTQYIKTYKDAARTIETRDFGPTDTVYVKAFTTQGTASSANSSWTYGDWTSTPQAPQTVTGLTSTMSGEYVLYSINLGSVTVNKTDGDWYYLRGRIRTSGGTTLSSLYTQIRIKNPDASAPSLPGVPSSTGKTDTTINLSWTAATDNVGVAGYTIYRSTAAAGPYYKAGTVTTGTTFTDKGLNPSTNYYYKVTAFDAAGNSNPEASATASAAIATNAAVPDTTKPSTPTGLNAIGNGAVILTWSASSDNIGVVGYIVYRGIDANNDGNPEYFLKAGSTTATEFTDVGLKAAMPYKYYVTAYDAAGNISVPTLTVTATEHSTFEDSIERALCMTCHDGSGSGPSIGTAYNNSKHNSETLVDTFSDGSEYFGNCTKCHEPHGSQYPNLLKFPNDNNMCYNCHTNASSSGKYGGKRDYELSSAHSKKADVVYDVYRVVWDRDHATMFEDHFGTDANWNKVGPSGAGISSQVIGSQGHLQTTLHSTATGSLAYAYAETKSTYSINSGITLTYELDLPKNPTEKNGVNSTEFRSDLYISNTASYSPTNDPANGNNWVRVRYTQTNNGTKVYVDKRIGGTLTNLYTDSTFKQFGGKTRNVRVVVTTGQLDVYDGPTKLVTATSLGLPAGNYYIDLGATTDTIFAMTTMFDDFKLHNNANGVKFNTQVGGVKQGGWYVKVYQDGNGTPLATVNTDANGQGTTVPTNIANKQVRLAVYDGSNNLKDISPNYFPTPDDTWTGSYELVAGATYTPKLMRGRVAGEEGICKNCHVTHGKQDIYGATIRALGVEGSSTNLNELCYKCHTDNLTWPAYPGNDIYKRDTHAFKAQLDATYGLGECANCHDPHGTPNDSMLRYPVNTNDPDHKNELCLKCHDNATVLANTKWFRGSSMYLNTGHDLMAKWPVDQPENRADLVEGVCLNCHNSHGKDDGTGTETNTRKMLPVGGSDNNSICYKCHDNTVLSVFSGGLYNPMTPYWPTTFNTSTGAVTRTGQSMYTSGTHSAGGIYPMVWPGLGSYPGLTLAEDGQCINCHDPHGSGVSSLLIGVDVKTLCTTCHNGTSLSPSLTDNTGTQGHITVSVTGTHSINENWGALGSANNHVTCSDCHNVHSLKNTTAKVTSPSGTVADNVYTHTYRIYGIDGVDKNLNKVNEIDPLLQYQLCLKCHAPYGSRALADLPGTTVSKDVYSTFKTTNASHHGVFGRTGNTYLTATTMTATGWAIMQRANKLPAGWPVLRCDDCHVYHATNNTYALKVTPVTHNLCILCHNTNVYYTGSTGGSRFNHHTSDHSSYRNCNNCHGGSYGFHGSDIALASSAGQKSKSFMTGTQIKGWKSTPSRTCYTVCGQHSSGKTY